MTARVLIADDEWIIAVALRRQLESQGYEVVGVAGTGQQALALCCSERPDLVLMDVQMPEMDGLEATRRVMSECPTCVVMVTGRARLEAEAERAGAMKCTMKPLLTGQVVPLVEAAQDRFELLLQLRRELQDADAVARAWSALTAAAQALRARGARTDGEAYRQLRALAAVQGSSLREAADRVLAVEPDSP